MKELSICARSFRASYRAQAFLDQSVRHRKQKRIVQLARLGGDDPERNKSRCEATTFWIVRARERVSPYPEFSL